jgi:hypothetical protein
MLMCLSNRFQSLDVGLTRTNTSTSTMTSTSYGRFHLFKTKEMKILLTNSGAQVVDVAGGKQNVEEVMTQLESELWDGLFIHGYSFRSQSTDPSFEVSEVMMDQEEVIDLKLGLNNSPTSNDVMLDKNRMHTSKRQKRSSMMHDSPTKDVFDEGEDADDDDEPLRISKSSRGRKRSRYGALDDEDEEDEDDDIAIVVPTTTSVSSRGRVRKMKYEIPETNDDLDDGNSIVYMIEYAFTY